MEIGIFNQTNEKLDKELDELKDMLSDFCKREGLGNVIFNTPSSYLHSILYGCLLFTV